MQYLKIQKRKHQKTVTAIITAVGEATTDRGAQRERAVVASTATVDPTAHQELCMRHTLVVMGGSCGKPAHFRCWFGLFVVWYFYRVELGHLSGIRNLPCVTMAVLAFFVSEEQDGKILCVFWRRGFPD